MRANLKPALIVAAMLCLAGVIIAFCAMLLIRFDFTKLDASEMIENTYDVKKPFTDIDVKTTIADITFIPSENSEVKVITLERAGYKYSVSAEDGVLKIVETRPLLCDIFNFSFKTSSIKVYLPKGDYGESKIITNTGDFYCPADFSFTALNIETSTGDIEMRGAVTDKLDVTTSTGDVDINNSEFGALELETSTGDVTVTSSVFRGGFEISSDTADIKIEEVECERLDIETSTGNVILKKTHAADKASIETDTGEVKFEGFDAQEIFVETSTGDVKGTILTGKTFDAKSKTGDVKTPDTQGGNCRIITSTGDIIIEIE